MKHKPLLVPLTLSLLATFAPAQGTTWIVDAAGGGQFTDIAPAEAAAAHGDIIIVRAGLYSPFATNKGIAVLGQGSVRILGSAFFTGLVTVSALPQGRTFSMRNVQIEFTGFTWGLELSNNAGRVHLHQVQISPQVATLDLSSGSGLRVDGCREVTVNACSLQGDPGIHASQSTLAVSSSTVLGVNSHGILGGRVTRAGAGMSLNSGVTFLSRTEVRGGNGSTSFFGLTEPPRSAIIANGPALILTGDLSTRVAAGILAGQPPLPGIVINGGSLDVDPNVVIQGAQGGPPISGSGTVNTRRIVALAADGGRLGGQVSAEVVSPAGDALSLLISLPVDPIPTGLGTVFFDPLLALGIVQGATQNAAERFTVGFTFPNLPALRGVAIVLQAANFYRATSLLELSNPVVLVLDN